MRRRVHMRRRVTLACEWHCTVDVVHMSFSSTMTLFRHSLQRTGGDDVVARDEDVHHSARHDEQVHCGRPRKRVAQHDYAKRETNGTNTHPSDTYSTRLNRLR